MQPWGRFCEAVPGLFHDAAAVSRLLLAAYFINHRTEDWNPAF